MSGCNRKRSVADSGQTSASNVATKPYLSLTKNAKVIINFLR